MKRILLIAALALASCSSVHDRDPRANFFDRLAALCGRTFEGRIVSPSVEADRDFAGKRIVMQVRDCDSDEIRIPLAVGDDRSRTWIVRRGGAGGPAALALAHDHRHADGSEDRLSRYGGATIAPGSTSRQEFPADAFSRELFARENITASIANVWAMEIRPGTLFAYELRRPGRFFRLEFDLRRPSL